MIMLSSKIRLLIFVLAALQYAHVEANVRRKLDALDEFSFFEDKAKLYYDSFNSRTAPVSSSSLPEPALPEVIYIPIREFVGTKGSGKGGSKSIKGSKGKGSKGYYYPDYIPTPGKGCQLIPGKGCVPIPTFTPPFPAPTLTNPAGQPVFIIAPPTTPTANRPTERPIDTPTPLKTLAPTTTPNISPTQAVTQVPTITPGELTATLFNAFIIGNEVGLVAADLVATGSEPGASNAIALYEGYALFIAYEVATYDSELSRRVLEDSGRHLQSDASVSLEPDSPIVYQINDISCPVGYDGSCQVVFGSYVVSFSGIEPFLVRTSLTGQTQNNILNMNTSIRLVDPSASIEVLGASKPDETNPPTITPVAAPVDFTRMPSRPPLPSGFTRVPTLPPSNVPSAGPTSQPTDRPSASPTGGGSTIDTGIPSTTISPSTLTIAPSSLNTAPSPAPSVSPSSLGSVPTSLPTITSIPSLSPSPSSAVASSSPQPTSSTFPTLSPEPTLSSFPSTLPVAGVATSLPTTSSVESLSNSTNVGIGTIGALSAGLLLVLAWIKCNRQTEKMEGKIHVDNGSVTTKDQSSSQELISSSEEDDDDDDM